VKDLAANRDQVLLTHEFDQAADLIAVEPASDRLDTRLLLLQKKLSQLGKGLIGDFALRRPIDIGLNLRVEGVLIQRMLGQLTDACVGQQATRPPARSVVSGGHAQDLIAFLEFTGGTDDLPVESLIEAPAHSANVCEDVFSRPYFRNAYTCGNVFRRRTARTLGDKSCCEGDVDRHPAELSPTQAIRSFSG